MKVFLGGTVLAVEEYNLADGPHVGLLYNAPRLVDDNRGDRRLSCDSESHADRQDTRALRTCSRDTGQPEEGLVVLVQVEPPPHLSLLQDPPPGAREASSDFGIVLVLQLHVLSREPRTHAGLTLPARFAPLPLTLLLLQGSHRLDRLELLECRLVLDHSSRCRLKLSMGPEKRARKVFQVESNSCFHTDRSARSAGRWAPAYSSA